MRVPTCISVAERARWLAELAAAVDEAQMLLWRMGVMEGDNADAKELYSRLECARTEIERLRGVRELAHESIDPQWMKLFPWNDRPTDPAT